MGSWVRGSTKRVLESFTESAAERKREEVQNIPLDDVSVPKCNASGGV